MANDVSSASQHHHGASHLGHIVPLPVLVGVLAALLVLTYVTVAATRFDLGSLNIWIALGIATVKGALVLLYFMHLRYDNPFNSIVVLTAIAFLCLFLGITLIDTVEYQPALREAMDAVP